MRTHTGLYLLRASMPAALAVIFLGSGTVLSLLAILINQH